MKNWFNKYYRTIIVSTFLVPIITVAVVSISHVTKWYGISNPFIWAVYLSIGIEIAALSALAAISADMGKKVYFPFGIVTLIQFIGNIYYTYYLIDVDSKSFISWVELVSPLIEFIGVEPTDLVGHRRFLSVFSGGMLPLISLSFLHMLVKFTEEDRIKYGKTLDNLKNKDNDERLNIINSNELIGEISKVRLSKDDLNRIENILLKKSQPKKNKNSNRKKVNKQSSEIIFPESYSTPINSIKNDELELDKTDEIEIKEEKIFDVLIDETKFLEEESVQEEINEIEDSNEILESEEKKKEISLLPKQTTVNYGLGKNVTDEDPLYWELKKTDMIDKNDVKKKETINENNGRIRKIITRNVGNTQRRWFE